jgi:hypothetical protein
LPFPDLDVTNVPLPWLPSRSEIIPGRYIIEFDSSAGLNSLGKRDLSVGDMASFIRDR